MLDPHALHQEDPQAQMFQGEWMRRRRRQRYAAAALIICTVLSAAVVFALAMSLFDVSPRFGFLIIPALFLPVLFYVLFSMVNCRCPRCSTNQSRLRNPRFCFNCGLRLRDE